MSARVHSYRCTNKQTGYSYVSLFTDTQANVVNTVVELGGIPLQKAEELIERWNKRSGDKYHYEVFYGTHSTTPEL